MQPTLSDQQLSAANFQNGIAIVIAIPGSGKTLTMTHRIANLVMAGEIPNTIVGITLTKNAAITMKDRLNQLLKDVAPRVILSTIHSLCYRILRMEGKEFTLITDSYKITLIRQILKQLKIKDLSTAHVITEIGLAKNNLIFSEDFATCTENLALVNIGRVYQLYEQEKDKKGLVDFEDLLVDTYQLLAIEEIRLKYQKLYKHLLIDEFQDTNPIMLEIVKKLVNGHGSLFVVGDDAQCIYSFTGASVGNILNFNSMFPGSQEFRLTMNYRSTPEILQACKNLIINNKHKIDKELITNNPAGSPVVLLDSITEDDEASKIVGSIKQLTAYKYQDIAILYRANFQSRAIEEALLINDIPYFIEGGQGFYQRKEVKVFIDYLRVIHSPLTADTALLNIINVPNRYLGNKFKNELNDLTLAKQLPIFQTLEIMSTWPTFESTKVTEFLELIKSISSTLPPSEIIKQLRATLDYDKVITDLDPDDSKIANIDQLIISAARFHNAAGFLEYADQFQKENKTDNKVRLMTIHKSKGMEFPIVFMIGLSNGIMPMAKGELEEERRIAFVGMSRASKILHLSWANTYNKIATSRSMFIQEMTL